MSIKSMLFVDPFVISNVLFCSYQCKAPLPHIRAEGGGRWGMVGESTANLPTGSGDLSLYINLYYQCKIQGV